MYEDFFVLIINIYMLYYCLYFLISINDLFKRVQKTYISVLFFFPIIFILITIIKILSNMKKNKFIS